MPDPWGGFNQGFNQLMNVLTMKRQEKRDESVNALAMEKMNMEKAEMKRKEQAAKMQDAVAYTEDMDGSGSPEDIAKFNARRSMWVQKWGEDPALPKEYDPKYVLALKGLKAKKFEQIGAGGLYDVTNKQTIPPAEKPGTPIVSWKTPTGEIKNLPQGQIPPEGSVKMGDTPAQPREINIPNWMDALGVEKFGEEYGTPEGRKKFLGWYNKQMADPKGRDEINQFQKDYTLRNTPQNITYLQTGEGFVPSITKGPGVGIVGQPTGLGKPVPQETQAALSFIGQIQDTYDQVKNIVEGTNDKKGIGWPGVASGAYGETLGRVLPTPEGYEDLRATLAKLQDIVYPKSGKAINEYELKILLKYVPQMGDKEETKKAKMKDFQRHLNSIKENYAKEIKEAGYGKMRESSPPKNVKPTSGQKTKPLDPKTAQGFVQEAVDTLPPGATKDQIREKAREIAQERGYKF